MEVTNVKLVKLNKNNRLRGVASITLDDEFVVHGIKIIESQKGLFIAMPSERKEDVFKDVAHPITTDARNKITNAILEKYNSEMTMEELEELDRK